MVHTISQWPLIMGFVVGKFKYFSSPINIIPSAFPTHSLKCHQHYIFWQLAASLTHTDLVTVMANFSKSPVQNFKNHCHMVLKWLHVGRQGA